LPGSSKALEHRSVVCDGETLSVSETWLKQQAPRKPGLLSVYTAAPLRRRENEERELIEAALEETNGRISGPSGAAHKLGIPRQTLVSKIATMGVDKYRFKSVNLAESCQKV
jgi:formate hydrogenlyase transcriptional activator